MLYFSKLLGMLWRDPAVSQLLFANRKSLQWSRFVYLVSIAMCLWLTHFSTQIWFHFLSKKLSAHLLKRLWSKQSFQKPLVICVPQSEEIKRDGSRGKLIIILSLGHIFDRAEKHAFWMCSCDVNMCRRSHIFNKSRFTVCIINSEVKLQRKRQCVKQRY